MDNGLMEFHMAKVNFIIQMDRIMLDISIKGMLMDKGGLSALKAGFMRVNLKINKQKEKEYYIIAI